MELWTIIGLVAVIYAFISFINGLGKTVPILEFMILIAGLQWIVGPLIEYSFPSDHYRYYMYVDQTTYMGYIVPAYSAFIIAAFLGVRLKDKIFIPIDDLKRYKKYGLTVFVIGVIFDLGSGYLPGTLGFFAFIVANFKFAGAIILFFSEDARLKKIFYFSIVYLFLRSLQAAMFHDLVLWSVFFYMFWALKFKPSKKQIYTTIFIGVFSLSTLQTIKAAYRSQIWNGYQGNQLELFVSLFVDALFFDDSSTNTEQDLTGDENNVRLNQGWIISAILDEIPKRVDYLEGTTIKEAVTASILPRFLNPDKKEAGGRENFMKFTGLSLGENTSMGISIIGEAYGNYGIMGGILFMGIWGYFLGWYWKILLKILDKNPLVLAFLPIIFLQVVKAETELVVVLNHLVKASIVVFLFFWAVRKILKWNLSHGQAY
ncbi:MAG: hypothetical protein AAF688_06845 [Bacteroidota bacterium]